MPVTTNDDELFLGEDTDFSCVGGFRGVSCVGQCGFCAEFRVGRDEIRDTSIVKLLGLSSSRKYERMRGASTMHNRYA